MQSSRFFLLLALASACGNSQTTVFVEIDGPAVLRSLHLDVKLGTGKERVHDYSGASGVRLPATAMVADLPNAPTSVAITVDAVDNDGRALHDAQTVASDPHHQVRVTLHLASPTGEDGGGDLAADLAQPDLAQPDLSRGDMADGSMVPVASDAGPPDFASAPVLNLVAGAPGGVGYVDGIGLDARINTGEGMVLSGSSLYFAEFNNGVIRKLDLTTKTITTSPVLTENGQQGYCSGAVGLVSDGTYFYVSCYYDHTVKKVRISDGQMSVIAGTSGTGGAPPLFNRPGGLLLDGSGNLYVTESANCDLRKIATPSGTPSVSVVAGTSADYNGNNCTQTADGTGTGAHFIDPRGMAIYNGDLYVNDSKALRKVTLPGAVVSTVINGQDGMGGSGLTSDGTGNLYIVDEGGNHIRKVVLGAAPSASIVAGVFTYNVDSTNGIGGAARFYHPTYLVLDGSGNAYVTESATIRKVALSSFDVETIVGTSSRAGKADSPQATRFDRPGGMVFDGNDTVYIAEYGGGMVRKLTVSTGNVITWAGNGQGLSGDGQDLAASFAGPTGITLDKSGNLYVTDYEGHCVRRISPSRYVDTIAGKAGTSGALTPSAKGADARFNYPHSIAYDGDHLLYVSDLYNNAIRAIDLSSSDFTVTTVMGDGTNGETPTRFDQPHGIAYDAKRKSLYVADSNGHVIRKLDLSNPSAPVLSKLAGTAYGNGHDDGSFANATFWFPIGLAFDPATQTLWVADNFNQAVRRLDLVAQSSTTPIGTPVKGLTKPGALPAFVHGSYGIAVTSLGVLVSSFDENSILLARGL
jgi:sugar lactone lactonase YvrE